MKQFRTVNSKKVNTVGAQGTTPRLYNSDIDGVEKYLDRDLVGF